jgi:hypothetical protein
MGRIPLLLQGSGVLGLFKQADAIAQLDTAPAPDIMKRSTKRNRDLSIRTKTTPTLTPAPLRPQHTIQGQGRYPTSPMGRSSPWGTPGAGEWRTAGGSFTPVGAGNPDDLARALSNLDINHHNINVGNAGYQGGQSSHPSRFRPAPSAGMRLGNMQGANTGSSRKLQLDTGPDGRKTPTQPGPAPGSAPAYVQAMGQQQQMILALVP